LFSIFWTLVWALFILFCKLATTLTSSSTFAFWIGSFWLSKFCAEFIAVFVFCLLVLTWLTTVLKFSHVFSCTSYLILFILISLFWIVLIKLVKFAPKLLDCCWCSSDCYLRLFAWLIKFCLVTLLDSAYACSLSKLAASTSDWARLFKKATSYSIF